MSDSNQPGSVSSAHHGQGSHRSGHDHNRSQLQYSYIDISRYANNNIYTDLNENFPNTGAGIPGSHMGAADTSFLFTPWTYTPPAAAASGLPYTSYSAPLGNNGVRFLLKSNMSGQDFAQIGNTDGEPFGAPYLGANPLTVKIGVDGVVTVYALMAAYNGQSFSVTFTGSGGSETFSNVAIPDFSGGVPVNSVSSNLRVQTVYQVQDVGAGGSGNSTTGVFTSYDLTEVAFTLNPALSHGQLNAATFTSNGYETLLLGLTTANSPSLSDLLFEHAHDGNLKDFLPRVSASDAGSSRAASAWAMKDQVPAVGASLAAFAHAVTDQSAMPTLFTYSS